MKRMKVLAAALVAGSASMASAAPKNVILMISDGQGFNSVVATDNYRGSTAIYEGNGFAQYAMQTYSASRPVAYNSSLMFNGTDATFAMSNYTDSASAATAMYTGVKNYDGEVNWATNDKPLTTFFEKA
ncbi:MAG: alkaline phosphatase [Phycisphaeraceae bacterium]